MNIKIFFKDKHLDFKFRGKKGVKSFVSYRAIPSIRNLIIFFFYLFIFSFGGHTWQCLGAIRDAKVRTRIGPIQGNCSVALPIVLYKLHTPFNFQFNPLYDSLLSRF